MLKKFNSKIGNFKIINESQNLIEIIDYSNLLNDKLIEIENKKPIFEIDADLEKQEYLVEKNLIHLKELFNNK